MSHMWDIYGSLSDHSGGMSIFMFSVFLMVCYHSVFFLKVKLRVDKYRYFIILPIVSKIAMPTYMNHLSQIAIY